MNSNMIMNSFLLSQDKELWKNKISYSKSAIDLQNLCKSIVNDTLDWKITFTTWIWLNDVWVPVRCPALITPALEVVRNLLQLWIKDIEYHIYQASSFIIKENSLDKNLSQNNSDFIKKYLTWYISEFYEDLYNNVIFDFDLNLDEKELSEVSWKIKSINWNSDVDFVVWQLINYANSKWKTENSALNYASANIISNWHVEKYYPVNNNWNIIIPIWWKKEKPFFNLWKVYEEKHNSKENKKIIIPILQRTWEKPTYYPTKWEDYINPNYDFIQLSWEKLDSSVIFDRDIVLSKLWKLLDFNELVKKILW